jgi:phosphoglycolate phosphatase
MRPLIVFDLDGTLIDSQRDLADSANEMLAAYGARPLPDAEIAGFVGDGARQLVARALEAASLRADLSNALERFLQIYGSRLFVHTRPYPGIDDAIAGVGGRAVLAVLTNKPEGFSLQLLEKFGWASAFRWTIGGDSPFGRKPDPAGLLHLTRLAGVAPHACLMVGDSMVDLETARAAGTAACVAQYGFGHLRRPIELKGTELVARRSEDLPARLEAFLGQTARRP